MESQAQIIRRRALCRLDQLHFAFGSHDFAALTAAFEIANDKSSFVRQLDQCYYLPLCRLSVTIRIKCAFASYKRRCLQTIFTSESLDHLREQFGSHLFQRGARSCQLKVD